MIGRCRRGAHCAAAETIEVDVCGGDCTCHTGPYAVCSVSGGCGHTHSSIGARLGTTTKNPHRLCTKCERMTTSAIWDLSTDYISLCSARRHGMTGNWTDVVSTTREIPIPFNLTFDTLAAQILHETLVFAEPVAEAVGIDWDRRIVPQAHCRYGKLPRYREEEIFLRACRLLTNAISAFLMLPVMDYRMWVDGDLVFMELDGATAALRLLALHRAAQSAIGTTRLVRRVWSPCPACKSHSLVRETGRDGVYCTTAECHKQYSELDYERLTLITVAEQTPPR